MGFVSRLIFLLLFSPIAQGQWVEGSIVGVPYYAPSQNAPVVFSNSVKTDDPAIPPDTWVTVTVPGLPSTAKAVHVVGVLIITQGYTYETSNFTLRLRRHLGKENRYSPDYIGQVIEVQPGGVRSPFAAWVAVDNGQFEVMWTRSTPPQWPDRAAYGFKLYVDAYVR